MTWEKIFFQNISTYINIINNYLSKTYPIENLGDYIKVQGGYAFKTVNYKNNGIPIIRISNFQKEKIVLAGVKYYDEKEELSRYELKQGDIIIAMTGGTIGKLAVVQSGLGKIYLNQRVGKFQILDKTKFHKEYVYWIARGVEEKVKKLGYGGAQPNVSNKQIENLKFPFPKLETQEIIVQFLNDFMNNKLNNKTYFDKNTEEKLINLQRITWSIHMDALKESENSIIYLIKLKESILQEAVQGKLVEQNPEDEPASILFEKIKKERSHSLNSFGGLSKTTKGQLIKEKKVKKEKPLPEITKDEIPYRLPKGWEWVRLQEVIQFNPRNKIDNELEVSFIPMKLVYDGFQNKHTDEIRLWKNIKNGFTHFAENDVAFAKITPCFENRKSAVMTNLKNGFGAGTTELIILRSYGKFILPKFILYLVKTKSFIDLGVSTYKGTAGQQRIKNDIIKNLVIGLPPLEEQKRIVQKVDTLMAYCDELEQEINNSKKQAEQLMQSVLKEAFEQKDELLKRNGRF